MAIRVEKIQGNIRTDIELRKKFEELAGQLRIEKIFLSRKNASKNRLRVTSNKDREILIDVPRGTTIRHGDVLDMNDEHMLIAEWCQEDTAVITAQPSDKHDDNIELGVKLGYVLGIKHWPLSAEGRRVYVPVEASRADVTKAFSHITHIEINFERRIIETILEYVGHENHA